jgi:phosphotransferase system enzyme I (PtsP)
MGAIAAVRRPSTRGDDRGPDDDALARFETALDLAQRSLAALRDRAGALALGRNELIDSCQVMLADQRLRRLTQERLSQGSSLAAAIGEVAGDAIRAATKSGDPFLEARAGDMEQLCDALVMLASPDARASLPSKAVLVADAIGVYDLLISARAQPAGVVLTGNSDGSQTLLRLLGVPAICDVEGAFRWVSPGDIALLDADHGFLIVNPSRAEVAAYRRERKRVDARLETPPADTT